MKHGLSIRGDSYYCPLSFSLDSYWNCEIECLHCYLRRLNRTWGKDLNPTDPETFRKKLINGLNNKNPQSFLAWAMKNKNTIRFGNKSDPFQPAELKLGVSRKLMKILLDLDWSFVIQTKNSDILIEYSSLIEIGNRKNLIWFMPIISPGLEKDWELFERKRTTHPFNRLRHTAEFKNTGVNGEPFIPGFHTVQDFENTLKLLRSWKIKSYNTYNLHFNDLIAKNLAGIGLDIKKIWTMNQDENWRPILQKLIDLSKKYGIRLSCPDFINSGWNYFDLANTCCGLNVPNPTRFNTHVWKKYKQTSEKYLSKKIIEFTWDGVGNKEVGQSIIDGTAKDVYTLKDII